MKSLHVFILFFVIGLSSLSAQGLNGSWNIYYGGTQYSANASQTVRPVKGKSTLEITKTGNDIRITMGDSGQGLWSAHIMSGQSGAKHFVATLSNGVKSIYTITGTLSNGVIKGTHRYYRYGNPSTGIVPGWTTTDFTAKK